MKVRDLAKELKISNKALMDLLKQLGVEVRSHMNILEDEIVEKIRRIFKQEKENAQKMDAERKRFHDARRRERKPEPEKPKAQKIEEPAVKEEVQEEPQNEVMKSESVEPVKSEKVEEVKSEKVEKAKQATPVFVEKPLVKTKSAEEHKEPEKAKSEVQEETKATTDVRHHKTKHYKSKPASVPMVDNNEPIVVPPAVLDELLTNKGKGKIKNIPAKAVEKTAKEKADIEKAKHLQAKLKHSKKGKKGHKEPTVIEDAEITRKVKQTLSKQKKKKYKKEDKSAQNQDNEPQTVIINEFTSVSELAKIMDVTPAEIIGKFFAMGKMTTMNQRLDRDSLEMICHEFEFEFKFADEFGSDIIEEAVEKHKDVAEVFRPPIVTIMGHVDHGKTSVLDYIRSTNVIAGEAGGITQHIGAYQVELKGQKITFIDTPGHEAFTAMRARGAHVTDIAIIVVAANDGVKPQTIEAIDHAKDSGVEIIIAINKIDLKTANIDKTINELAKQNLYLEGHGGSILWTPCSALNGKGISDLLENILLVAEMKELKAKYEVPGSGYVIEAEKDSQKGAMVTILMKEGTLSKGDIVVCGANYGKIRRMDNERGKELKKIGPADIALLYGLNDVPKAGDVINAVDNEKTARQISMERRQIRQERERFTSRTNFDNLFAKIKEQEMIELKLILKADTDGSVEALSDSLQKLSNESVVINIIHRSVGGILETDVSLAEASDAVIIGFNVRTEPKAKKTAEDQHVQIKNFQIIYDCINYIQDALIGLTPKEYEDKVLGSARVNKVFKIKGVGSIAGCFVEKGKVNKTNQVKIFRNNILIHKSKLSSLKHFSEEVSEINAGSECGIGIHNFNDIKEGDILELFETIEIQKSNKPTGR